MYLLCINHVLEHKRKRGWGLNTTPRQESNDFWQSTPLYFTRTSSWEGGKENHFWIKKHYTVPWSNKTGKCTCGSIKRKDQRKTGPWIGYLKSVNTNSFTPSLIRSFAHTKHIFIHSFIFSFSSLSLSFKLSNEWTTPYGPITLMIMKKCVARVVSVLTRSDQPTNQQINLSYTNISF